MLFVTEQWRQGQSIGQPSVIVDKNVMAEICAQDSLQSSSVHLDHLPLLGLTTSVEALTVVSMAPLHSTVASHYLLSSSGWVPGSLI